jgi:hypothetical protein
MTELRHHVDVDLQSLLSNLKKYISIDREALENRGLVDINSKANEAISFINNSNMSVSM